jgi:hypothetical protein
MSEEQSLTKYQHWLDTVIARAVLLSEHDALLVLLEGEADKLTLSDAIELLAKETVFEHVEFKYPARREVEKNADLSEDSAYLPDNRRFHARASVLDAAESALSFREEIIHAAESAQASGSKVWNLLCIVDADEELYSGITKPLPNVVYLDAADEVDERVPDLETMIFRLGLFCASSPGVRTLSTYTDEPQRAVVALRQTATYIASHARALQVVKARESAGGVRPSCKLNTSVPVTPKTLPKQWFNRIRISGSNDPDVPWFKTEEYDKYFREVFFKNQSGARNNEQRQELLDSVVHEARQQAMVVGESWRLCHGHTLESLLIIVLEQCGLEVSSESLKILLHEWLYASDWHSASLFRRIRDFLVNADRSGSSFSEFA